MPIIQVSYNPTDRVALVQDNGASVPAGSTKIGTFSHPDETYPDSYVIFHGVRDLLYFRKPDGTEGFFPDNITDMQSITINSALTVPIPVTGVSLSPATASVAVGATTQLTPTFTPTNATDKGVTYETSDAGVATVNTTGLVTGVAEGPATITVTTEDGNKTATSTITVTAE